MHAQQLATVLLLVACHGGPARGEQAQQRAQVSFTTPQGPVVVDVEIAATERAREQGLMYRKSMPANAGMVFVFPAPSPHTFWMKNTYIPLDMVFVNAEHTVIGVVPSAEPLTLTGRAVRGLSKFVVELNGGTCARLGIGAGSTVTFTGVPENPTE